MPVTGSIDQEHPTQESVEQTSSAEGSSRRLSLTDQTLDSSGAEVSSTTVDLDPVSETGQAEVHHGDASDHVQSTSIDASSDSLDEFRGKTATAGDSKPGAGTSRGFQDAFAAFASATSREMDSESSVDVCNNVSEATCDPRPEAVISPASDSVHMSTVDSMVSSAIDSAHVTTTVESLVRAGEDVEHVQHFDTESGQPQVVPHPGHGPYNQQTPGIEQSHISEQTAHNAQYSDSQPTEAGPSSDSVYFVQMTDASGQVVTSIIDPNDISSYTNSVVYKQCMRSDGEIETTVVHSGSMAVPQEQPHEEQQAAVPEEGDFQQGEQQIIYAHDLNGHLTPIDSAQSFNDVAPPGKQFVYMQDSSGRIIRTIMDANQTMVPGQQVYYTQSDDGRIITSVMDPATAGVSDEPAQGQQLQEAFDQMYQQQVDESSVVAQQSETSAAMVGSSSFNIDNSMSGLSMLAELSHLTSGHGLSAEQITASSTDSSSMDQDDFRPIATVTRQTAGDEGVESVSSEIAGLKVEQEETLITRFVSELKEEQIQACTVSRDNLFVQWQNLDAMCWMDVVLIMLVNSPSLRLLVNLDPSHELASTLLITLLKANRQAQIILQNILKKSSGAEISSLQTGAGNAVSIQDPKTSKLVCKENMDEIGKAINILYAMREKIWQALQPRLRCERGKHNSPVLVLPLLVREKPVIKQMFTMNYRYVFKCKQCGYSQDDSHTKILPSIPTVPEDFTMQAPCFVRNCFECQAPNQRMLMKFELLHDFVQMHFVKGLPHNRFDELSFDFNDDHYEVTAVVHYKNNPDHFIAWVRNAPGPAWMECDDLKSVITCYSNVTPSIPPSQVHMVMWERRLAPRHMLVMRDTEDTKLLASLVLTVQQPSTQPPVQPNGQQSTADQVTKAAGVPATPGAAAPGSPVTTPAQSSVTQPGLLGQSLSSSAARIRGRGRAIRGTRGPAVTATTPVIRRVAPTVTQLLSPAVSSGSQSPQVIRLPLSALASSGLTQRGTTGSTRYVLVGNNSVAGTATATAPTRTNAPSKVVVVRSQGGASGISAAQLLQLLQRTGAISQSGTRITTTVTTSGGHTDGAAAPAATTASYIIQQDGSIVAAPPAGTDVAGSQASIEKAGLGQTMTSTSLLGSSNEEGGESSMETESVGTQQNELIRTSVPAQSTISTLPYVGTSTMSAGQSQSDIIRQSPQALAASLETSSPLSSSSHLESGGEVTAACGQAVATPTPSQQPSRYIQVPNPAGGGHLLCQLVMRDGKMVLVPVDKTVHSQVSGTSVLKLSSPQSSPKITIRVPTTSSQASAVSPSGVAFPQLQQQLLQSQASGPGPRIITVPGSAGNKRIQLITVPRGPGAAKGSQQSTKTIIVNSANSQQGSVSTTARLISAGGDMSVTPQSSSIVIRELKPTEGDGMAALSPLDTAEDSSASGQAATTQTVSVLRDVAARGAAASVGTSLLTSPSRQQKASENFRYILPGSNTTHILHTGTVGVPSGLGQAGKAFTALSSSGTIIGGQLTPSPTTASVETSPMDQDLSLDSSDDTGHTVSLLSHRRQLSRELDTTEYIPLGRSHGRGRGQRGGRSRGGRLSRGRGRSQLWAGDADVVSTPPGSGRKISTLADLRQIGAHVIEAGSETVDGVPVVSIPDYSTEGTGQSEILSAAQSIISDTSAGTFSQELTGFSNTATQLGLPGTEQETLTLPESLSATQGPRVITQSIPSVRATHGFDILTQGILGATNTGRASVRQRSLLTGATTTTTLQTASSLLSSLREATASSLGAPAVTVQQAEIDTLIRAAQAAAKPSIVGSQAFAMGGDQRGISGSLGLAGQLVDGDFGTDDLIKASDVDSSLGMVISKESLGTIDSVVPQLDGREQPGLDETVVSVDESLVSAAERYRMPVELFQPDEESPEKSLKLDDPAGKLTADLPSKLFQESDMSPFVEEMARSVLQHSRAVSYQTTMKEPFDPAPGINETDDNEVSMDADLSTDGGTAAVPVRAMSRSDAVETADNRIPTYAGTASSHLTPLDESATNAAEEGSAALPHKPVRSRGRPKGSTRKRGGRKKSQAVCAPESTKAAGDKSDLSAGLVVTPESSPDRNITHVISQPEMLMPIKSSKLSSADISSASDFILTKSDDEKENIVEESVNLGADVLHESFVFKKKPKQSIAREEFMVIKCPSLGPAFVRHKNEKVNWCVSSDSDVMTYPASHFNYRVLSGKLAKSPHRHVSLGPRQESFTSVLPSCSVKKSRVSDKLQALLPAVVVRRCTKQLEKPKSDPTKVPIVVPLVTEDNCDPACTGGSVVTSPDGGEVFAGIVLKHRSEMVDWNMSVDKEMEEVTEHVTDEELRLMQREYLEHLRTELYIHAGDFNSSDEDSEDEDRDMKTEEKYEEEVTERFTNTAEITVDRMSGIDSSLALNCANISKTGSLKGKQKKRKHSSGLPLPDEAEKKVLPDGEGHSQMQSPSHSASCSDIDSADNSSAAVSSRINGTDPVTSVLPHPPQGSELGSARAQPKEALSHLKGLPMQQHSNSPSRRSSRTPIPSKKVLDSWDDYPARSALKDKRTLSQSSDDELSGYNSGDVQRKKQKTKSTFIPS